MTEAKYEIYKTLDDVPEDGVFGVLLNTGVTVLALKKSVKKEDGSTESCMELPLLCHLKPINQEQSQIMMAPLCQFVQGVVSAPINETSIMFLFNPRESLKQDYLDNVKQMRTQIQAAESGIQLANAMPQGPMPGQERPH